MSELGVTKAVSSGVKTRAKLRGALKGPLYWGLCLVDREGVHGEVDLDHGVTVDVCVLGNCPGLCGRRCDLQVGFCSHGSFLSELCYPEYAITREMFVVRIEVYRCRESKGRADATIPKNSAQVPAPGLLRAPLGVQTTRYSPSAAFCCIRMPNLGVV